LEMRPSLEPSSIQQRALASARPSYLAVPDFASFFFSSIRPISRPKSNAVMLYNLSLILADDGQRFRMDPSCRIVPL
jgi:hypothetical protein